MYINLTKEYKDFQNVYHTHDIPAKKYKFTNPDFLLEICCLLAFSFFQKTDN